MADSDFDAITMNRKLCDANGNIGSGEFCNIMMQQIRYYTQQRLSENAFTKFKTPEDAEFTHLGALKLILLEQFRQSSTLDTLAARLPPAVPEVGGAGANTEKNPLAIPPKAATAAQDRELCDLGALAVLEEQPETSRTAQSPQGSPGATGQTPATGEWARSQLDPSCDRVGSIAAWSSLQSPLGSEVRNGLPSGHPPGHTLHNDQMPPTGPGEVGAEFWAAAVAGRCAAAVEERMSAMVGYAPIEIK